MATENGYVINVSSKRDNFGHIVSIHCVRNNKKQLQQLTEKAIKAIACISRGNFINTKEVDAFRLQYINKLIGQIQQLRHQGRQLISIGKGSMHFSNPNHDFRFPSITDDLSKDIAIQRSKPVYPFPFTERDVVDYQALLREYHVMLSKNQPLLNKIDALIEARR